jgi:calmodulin
MQQPEKKRRRNYNKETQQEKLDKIEIKGYEKVRLNYVFDKLMAYEEEPSSDENSKEKQYQMRIAKQAEKKKMKKIENDFKSKSLEKKKKKKFKEDEEKNNDMSETERKMKKEEEEKKKKKERKFSVKALRKVIRTLCGEFTKEELNNLIWECDDNLDGFVSEKEFINMYKKCITDENEEEGKKMFYLIQFLMFDKDEKHEITIEDTLEILCARNPNNVDQALDNIFDEDINDDNNNTGKKKQKAKKESIRFLEYAQRMHDLSMKKRKEISNAKKILCEKIKQEALENAKNRNFNKK